ncbi:MAG: hypothetical protein K6F54_03165 [Lachnospiraceae bacterium]|nr:hypothetical protein [Lachnospiraceae bacterium]
MERIELFDMVLIKRINRLGKAMMKSPKDGRWLVSCENENATGEKDWKKALILCWETDLQLIHKGSKERDSSFDTIKDLSPEMYEIEQRFKALPEEKREEFMEFAFENLANESIKLDQLS